MVIYQLCLTRAHALVAQLDRVTGYEPVGQGFESLRAHHKKSINLDKRLVLFSIKSVSDFYTGRNIYESNSGKICQFLFFW